MSARSVRPDLPLWCFLSDSFVEAFIAIGHIAKAVGSEMKPFLDSVMQQVKLGLQNRG
jgi:hypothetical protein